MVRALVHVIRVKTVVHELLKVWRNQRVVRIVVHVRLLDGQVLIEYVLHVVVHYQLYVVSEYLLEVRCFFRYVELLSL